MASDQRASVNVYMLCFAGGSPLLVALRNVLETIPGNGLVIEGIEDADNAVHRWQNGDWLGGGENGGDDAAAPPDVLVVAAEQFGGVAHGDRYHGLALVDNLGTDKVGGISGLDDADNDYAGGTAHGDDAFFPLPTLLLCLAPEWHYVGASKRGVSAPPDVSRAYRRVQGMPWVEIVHLPATCAEIWQGLGRARDWAELKSDLSAILVEDRPPEDVSGLGMFRRWSRGTCQDSVSGQTQAESLADAVVQLGQSGDVCDGTPEAPFKMLSVLDVGRPAEDSNACEPPPSDSVEPRESSGILLDMQLRSDPLEDPSDQFDGLAVLARLKSTSGSPDHDAARCRHRRLGFPPVIVLTGHRDKEHVVRSIRAEADAYLPKVQMASGHDAEVNWPASLLYAFNVLFVLHAKRLWLQRYLFRLAKRVVDGRDTVMTWTRRTARGNDDSMGALLGADIFDELSRMFPLGSVPPFLHELHRASEVVAHAFAYVPVSPEGAEPIGWMQKSAEILAALSDVPEPHLRPCDGADRVMFATPHACDTERRAKEKERTMIEEFSALVHDLQHSLAQAVEQTITWRAEPL